MSGGRGAFERDELIALLEALERAAARDAALRAGLARVHELLGLVLERAEPAARAPQPLAPRAREDEAPREREARSEEHPAREESFGTWAGAASRAGAEAAPARGPRRDGPEGAEHGLDLALVVRRTRLKAEACRWAAERRRRLEEGRDYEETVRPRDQDLVRRAKELPACFLWPLSRYEELPNDASLETLAGAYEALGAAAGLCLLARERAEDEEPALETPYQLLAEAQSALRQGIASWTSQRVERDQDDAFHWLRRRTEEDRVYVARHMRLQDPADPQAWHERLERIEAERARLERARDGERRVHQGLNRLRYHAQRAADPLSAADAREHARAIARAVEELVDAGLRPSDVRLREVLLPLVEELFAELEPGPGLSAVLEQLDRHLALSEAEEGPRAARVEPRGEDVPELERARELLRGKRVVLVGGHERHRTREALEAAFALRELRWIAAAQGVPSAVLESELARADTALVLLATRWAAGSQEPVARLCAAHDKALVRLTRGYDASAVARAVLEQAGQRLA